MKNHTHQLYRCSATAIIVFFVFAMMLYALMPVMALPGHPSGTQTVTYSDDGETLEGASEGEGEGDRASRRAVEEHGDGTPDRLAYRRGGKYLSSYHPG